MKTFYLICIFTLCFHYSQSQNSQKLKFTLNIVHTEKSKDSHTRNEMWKLEGKELTYYQSFTGRLFAKKPVRKTQQLSEEQIISIEKLMATKELYKNIPSPKYTEFMKPYTAVNTNLLINKDKSSFAIELYDLASEITKNAEYQGIASLVDLINGMMKE